MNSFVKTIRVTRYYWPTATAVFTAWMLASFGKLTWTQAFVALGLSWLVLQVHWMAGRYRALRKAGRLIPPVPQTAVLRAARAAVTVDHDHDTQSLTRRLAWLTAAVVTVGRMVLHVCEVTGTLVQHRAIDGHRVYRARTNWDVALGSKKVGLVQGREKRVPFLSDPHTTIDLDVEAWVKPGRLGYVVQDIADVASRVAEVVGCKQLAVTPGDKVGVGLLRFYWTDPLARHLGIRDMPVPKTRWTVAYGIRRGGEAATIDLDKSLLIGGLTGTGKSSLMWAMWAAIIRAGFHVDLWVSDPKGGMELDALERFLNVHQGPFRIRRYVRNAKDTTTMVNDFEKELRTRQAALKKAGVRKHHPSAEFPQMILVLDELLPLVEMLKKGTASTFGQILFEGRAAGFTVWANSQVGHADSLGTNRNLFPTRLCLGMPTSQATDTILGDGSEMRGAKCSELGKNVRKNAGLGWSVDENGRLQPFRVAYVSDEGSPSDIDVIASAHLPAGMADENTVEPLAVGETVKVAVYRVYGPEEGKGRRLWYVGISNAPGLRFDQHRDRDQVRDCPICGAGFCDWWRTHVDPHRGDPDRCPAPRWYPDRKTALQVEREAIIAETPLMNKVHNQGNPFGRRLKAKVAGGKARRFATRKTVTAPEPSRRTAVAHRPWKAVAAPLAGNPLSPATAPSRPDLDEPAAWENLSAAERDAVLDGVGFGAE